MTAKQTADTLQAEQGVVGLVIANPDLGLPEIGDLKADELQDRNCKLALAAIRRLQAQGKPIDGETVSKESKIPAPILQGIIDAACPVASCAYHAQQIESAYLQRKLIEIFQNAPEGKEGLRYAHKQAGELLPQPNSDSLSIESLADLPDPRPETENQLALFRNGYLRKGGGLFLVSPSGQGKSTAAIQTAICWAMGKSVFGIEPVRPLKIVIIQAEDDGEEMAHFRNQITEGLVEVMGFDRLAINEAVKARVLICSMNGCTGEKFADRLATLLETEKGIDLVIVNPLLSFAGCDLARPSEATRFFRELIDPVIKPNDHGRVGILFVHHTNKPPQAKDRNGWGSDVFSSYVGSGAADITNWARAMLAIMPCEKLAGVFRLVAGKRGRRLGWTDANGCQTTTRYIAHSEGRIFWRDADPEEISEASQATGNRQEEQRATMQTDAKALAAWACHGDAKSMTELRTHGTSKFSNQRTRRALAELCEHPEAHSVTVWQDAKTKRGFIGLASAVGRKLQELGIKHDTQE